MADMQDQEMNGQDFQNGDNGDVHMSGDSHGHENGGGGRDDDR
jgi:hypothetical protein